jgi:hypothetical protein
MPLTTKRTFGVPESHVILALDDRASRSDIDKLWDM